MDDGLHLAAPDLLGPPALGERGNGSHGIRVGLFFQDRLEVAVQPPELGGKLPLRQRAARGDAVGRLVPEVGQEELEQLRGPPRGRIAPSSWERNGLPSTAISASGSRSSASSENATRSDGRSRKNGRSPGGRLNSA